MTIERCYFSNLAPMWGKENMSKNNRFVTVLPLKVLAERERFVTTNGLLQTYFLICN